jgi:hypothetical protein
MHKLQKLRIVMPLEMMLPCRWGLDGDSNQDIFLWSVKQVVHKPINAINK